VTELSTRELELLQALVTGEEPADSAEVRRLLATRPSFAERLSELRAAQTVLERTSADAQATRRAAAELQSAPGEDGLSRPPRRAWALAALPLPAWVGLAAAALLALLALRGVLERRPAQGELWMGPEGVELVRPVGSAADFGTFEWSGTLPPRAEYRVTVLVGSPSASAGHPAGAILLQHRTTSTQWSPTPVELALLSAHITWEVEVYLDGQLLASGAAAASR
jgi:hypothetical protein